VRAQAHMLLCIFRMLVQNSRMHSVVLCPVIACGNMCNQDFQRSSLLNLYRTHQRLSYSESFQQQFLRNSLFYRPIRKLS